MGYGEADAWFHSPTFKYPKIQNLTAKKNLNESAIGNITYCNITLLLLATFPESKYFCLHHLIQFV